MRGIALVNAATLICVFRSIVITDSGGR